MDEEDLKMIFTNFGPIRSLDIDFNHPGVAWVTFQSVVSGYLAIEALNGVSLPIGGGSSVNFKVSWDAIMLKDDSEDLSNGLISSNAKYTCRYEI